jgi:hypothetical protein
MCQASIEVMFPVSANAALTDAQYASWMAGNLHVNVHSAAYPGGAIRVQLSPKQAQGDRLNRCKSSG